MSTKDTVRFSTWLFLAAAVVSTTIADYPCICSYSVENPVYTKADINSAVIGQMYEFDCKPEYTASPDLGPDWDTLMIDKQIGYIHTSSAMSKSTCQGSIPIEDKVTTGRPTTPTTTSSTYTTASPTVTTSSPSVITITPAPSSGAPITSSNAPISSKTATQTVSSSTAPQNNNNGTSSTATSQSATAATTVSSSSTTSKATTQSRTSSTTTKPSTASPSTTKQSISTPSTTMLYSSTTTTTTTSTTRRPTTQHYNQQVTTHAPQMTYTCPSNVIQAAAHNHGVTGVYGSTCYELVPGQYHWQAAETNCRNKGGHLVHIQNAVEESHVMTFLYNHGFKHAVWLGLTDMLSENNFRWTSGDPVTYTKWLPGHTSNFESHHYEDCVVLVPYIHTGFFYRSYGLWDDIDCTLPHSWICQFDAVPTQGAAGSGAHGNIHFTTKTPMVGSLGHIFDLIGRK